MAANKCNITDIAVDLINHTRYGFSCRSNEKKLFENYLESLNCSQVFHTNCYVDTCINNPVTVIYPIIYWGWKDTNDILSETNIELSSHTAIALPNSVKIADYTANTDPKYLWMAIPITEPISTSWYGAVNNDGLIGDNADNSNLFKSPIISGKYYFYITNWQTQQQDTTIQFKH